MAKATLMARAKAWGKKQGQTSINGFEIVQESIDQVVEGRNWDVLAQILGRESSWSESEKSVVN